MKISRILFCLVSVALLVSGCATGKLGMVGTRNIDYSATYEKGGPTEAKNTVAFFVIFPVAWDELHAMEVIDLALAEGGYDFLTDVEISVKSLPLWPIYVSTTLSVKGTGWRKAGSHANMDIHSGPLLAYEENGELKLTNELPPELLEGLETHGLLNN